MVFLFKLNIKTDLTESVIILTQHYEKMICTNKNEIRNLFD